MNFLVTGGFGFIGSNFINVMARKYTDSNFYNIDCLRYCGDKSNIKEARNVKSFIYEIKEKIVYDIFVKYKITHVVHFAAQSHVDTSYIDQDCFIRDNITTTFELLNACKSYGKLKLFINMSTDEVYGENNTNVPLTEESRLNPTNPYAVTKAAAEMACISYSHSYNLPVITIRCNNVYGPNQYVEKLIPKFISLLKNNKKCTIHGDGSYRRTFIHVNDLCSAIDLIISNTGNPVLEDYTIFNVGSENEFSVLDIAKILINNIKGSENYDLFIEYVPDRVFNDSRYLISLDKIHSLGFQPRHNFIFSLKNLCNNWIQD
jgi:dTDP-glucose 4,6-dehydratase